MTPGAPSCFVVGMSVRSDSPSDIDAISLRLTLTRRALGLNKAEFADRAKISRTAYHNWEPRPGTKPIGRPSIDEANRLCETYDLTMDWIYRGDRRHLPWELVEAIDAVEREMGVGRYAAVPIIPKEPLKKRA